MLEALVLEIAEPAPGNSLDRLTEIMEDAATPVGRRIDCAAVLLGFQTAPGALAEASAESLAAGGAYRFLKGLSATPIPPPLQVRVLGLLANVEAVRARL